MTRGAAAIASRDLLLFGLISVTYKDNFEP
jgi:hypothetical protein